MGGRQFDTPPSQSIDREMSRSAITFEILHAHFFFFSNAIYIYIYTYIHSFRSKQCTCVSLIDLIFKRRRVTAIKLRRGGKLDLESMIKFEIVGIELIQIIFFFFLFLCVYWNVHIAPLDTRLFLAIQINYNIYNERKKRKKM